MTSSFSISSPPVPAITLFGMNLSTLADPSPLSLPICSFQDKPSASSDACSDVGSEEYGADAATAGAAAAAAADRDIGGGSSSSQGHQPKHAFRLQPLPRGSTHTITGGPAGWRPCALTWQDPNSARGGGHKLAVAGPGDRGIHILELVRIGTGGGLS